jgi:hypothetical protein
MTSTPIDKVSLMLTQVLDGDHRAGLPRGQLLHLLPGGSGARGSLSGTFPFMTEWRDGNYRDKTQEVEQITCMLVLDKERHTMP